MQNIPGLTYGVSPAYFFSSYGEQFGPNDVIKALPGVAKMGYTSFEAEVFDPIALEEWTETSSRQVFNAGADLGLRSDIFAAHFLGESFSSIKSLTDQHAGITEFEHVLSIVAQMNREATVVIPMMPLNGRSEDRKQLFDACVAKITQFALLAKKNKVRIAVESVPGGLVENGGQFCRLCDALPGVELCFLLDTGNVWATGENLIDTVEMCGDRIVGVHFCDARGMHERSVEPGDGSVALGSVTKALQNAGFTGSMDIEIACSAPEVLERYSRALLHVQQIEKNLYENKTR